MTTRALERADWQGAPAIGGRLRPTSAVSGGAYGPSGDGRVQPSLHGADADARSAVLSPDGAYRYLLARRWGSGPRALFVGLNPSTADAAVDDASTRRMVGFARAAGCGSLSLVNLYAWRSTSPVALRQVTDPIGPDNDTWIMAAAEVAELVVAAWGSHAAQGRAATVLQLLGCVPVWCLGQTKDGHPRHPLYLPARTPLEAYRPAVHDWGEWHRVINGGLPEALRERLCLACGADQVAVDASGSWS